jgi:hypothetical protein
VKILANNMGNKIKTIVFVNYLDRSGSTFLMSRLNCFKNAIALPESEALIDGVLYKKNKKEYLSYLLNEKKFNNWKIEHEKLYKIFNDYNENSEIFLKIVNLYKDKFSPESEVVFFKRSKIIFDYDILLNKFKNFDLKMISLIRNPFSIYLSMINTFDPFENRFFKESIYKYVKYWNINSFFTSKYKKSIFVIRYEDLKQNLDKIMQNFGVYINRNYEGDIKCIEEYYNRLSDLDKKLHKHIMVDSKSFINTYKKKMSIFSRFLIAILTKKKRKIFNY